MKASQLREFEDPGIVTSVILAGVDKAYLEIAKDGTLKMPAGVEPKGFHVVVAFEENSHILVVQKNVGTEGGGYHRDALSKLDGFEGFKSFVMHEPIEVVRIGGNVWTSWHQQKPNRVDCWVIGADGKLGLFQIGVFTHDNGATWKLHGEYRWRGQLYEDCDLLVARPEHPRWGSLEGGSSHRTQIFSHPEFVALMKDVKLTPWIGTDEELDPQLPEVPGPGFAVVQWYIAFAGQTGQGPANLLGGGTAWIHGADIIGLKPDADGETRLWRGDIVSYAGKTDIWGSKKGGPPKLAGVKLVSRAS